MRPKMPIIAQIFFIPWLFYVGDFIKKYFIEENHQYYTIDFFTKLLLSLFTIFLLVEFYYRRKPYTRKVIIWLLVFSLILMSVMSIITFASGTLSMLLPLIFNILFLIYFIRSKKVKEALNIQA